MTTRIPQLPQLNLTRGPYDQQPLFVDMEAFFEFSFWIAEELLDLEARLKHRNRGRLHSKKVLVAE